MKNLSIVATLEPMGLMFGLLMWLNSIAYRFEHDQFFWGAVNAIIFPSGIIHGTLLFLENLRV